MFEGLDMNKMLEQMQNSAKKIEEESNNIEFTAKAGGGLLTITAKGNGQVIDIDINETLLEDKSSLQIMLISAVNDINKMVEDNKKSQAMNIMGGMNPFGNQG